MRAVAMNGCSPSTEYGTSLFVIDNKWYQPYPRPGASACKSLFLWRALAVLRQNPDTKSETVYDAVKAYS